MIMTVQDRLQADLKEAMRSGDKLRVNVIRSARAALQNAQLETAKQEYDAAVQDIETRLADDPAAREAALSAISADYHAPLDPAAQEAVIAREVKRRRDSADAYRQANRTDLAETEEAEARILEEYLPQQLTADELRPQIIAVIDELGVQGPADMGKLMPVLMERFRGRAEGRMLSQLARELLAGR
jgi:hypothetical protein